jgi:hypothetical protein
MGVGEAVGRGVGALEGLGVGEGDGSVCAIFNVCANGVVLVMEGRGGGGRKRVRQRFSNLVQNNTKREKQTRKNVQEGAKRKIERAK